MLVKKFLSANKHHQSPKPSVQEGFLCPARFLPSSKARTGPAHPGSGLHTLRVTKALFVVENLTHGLAGHGGRLRAVPSKPPRASASLKRRVACGAPQSLSVKVAYKILHNFFVEKLDEDYVPYQVLCIALP